MVQNPYAFHQISNKHHLNKMTTHLKITLSMLIWDSWFRVKLIFPPVQLLFKLLVAILTSGVVRAIYVLIFYPCFIFAFKIFTDLCPCSCEYRSKVDYWASHNVTNMTYDEIVVWLQPKIKELEKTLTVDKSNLSSLINKRISMKDDRPSARSIGYIGIVILSVVFVLILFIDVSSITRHTQNIKRLWGVKKWPWD